MATTRGEPEPEGPTRSERVESIARSVVAGHPQGAMRRIVLYAILGAAFLTLYGMGEPGIAHYIVGAIGALTFTLLIATDSL